MKVGETTVLLAAWVRERLEQLELRWLKYKWFAERERVINSFGVMLFLFQVRKVEHKHPPSSPSSRCYNEHVNANGRGPECAEANN